MASIKEVHEIIHSLGKFEKIQLNLYFNTFATKASNNYLSDYQCFIKIKKFDKEKITKALNKVKTRKNLSESNTNLYNFILDSLVKMNLNKNEKLGLLKEIQSIELMFDKGIYEQCSKRLIALKKEISKSRNEKLRYYLFDLENELLLRQAKNKNTYDKRLDLLDEQIEFVSTNDFVLKFRKLKTLFFALMAKIGMPRTLEQQREYLDLGNNALLKTKNGLVPKTAYLDFFYVKFMLQLIAQPKENEKAIKYLKEGVEMIQKNIDIKTNYLPYYIIPGITMQAMSVGNNEEELRKSIRYYESITPYFKSTQHQIASKVNLQTAYLLSSLSFNNIDEGYQYLVQNKEAILDKENLKYSPHAYTNYLSCARVSFLKEDFEQSLEFIEILINMKDDIRKSLLPPIYMLYLLNQLKMKNTMYLPYAIRSLYKSFLKLGNIYEPEKAVLSFLRKSINLVDVQVELQKLYSKLVTLKKDPFHNSFFGNGDYIIWLENEIKR